MVSTILSRLNTRPAVAQLGRAAKRFSANFINGQATRALHTQRWAFRGSHLQLSSSFVMRKSNLNRFALESSISDRQLLSHPFYRRWDSGELSISELRLYAKQSGTSKRRFRGSLRNCQNICPEGLARESIISNLADEIESFATWSFLWGRMFSHSDSCAGTWF